MDEIKTIESDLISLETAKIEVKPNKNKTSRIELTIGCLRDTENIQSIKTSLFGALDTVATGLKVKKVEIIRKQLKSAEAEIVNEIETEKETPMIES